MGRIVITMGWAVGVFTGVLIAAVVSGAHINPAVILALVLAGKCSASLFSIIEDHFVQFDGIFFPVGYDLN